MGTRRRENKSTRCIRELGRNVSKQRLHKRISYVVQGKLHCRGDIFICQIQNLSMGGAFITINNTPETNICVGDACLLQMRHEIDGLNIVLEAMVIHCGLSSVGMAFKNLDGEKMALLAALMERDGDKSPV